MRFPVRRLFSLAMLLAVGGCEEEMTSLESGNPSSLDVRVYVDADGNGAYDTSADVGIGSATVTATPVSGGGSQASAQTDADGRATFSSLSPGSWALSVSGPVPAGAVLATATSPVVAASFQGGALNAEFRYSYLPGGVSGRLFRDDNGNGSFDADADLPAAGIGLELWRGVSTTGDPLVEGSTAPDGSFSFSGLRPGTYTMVVDAPETVEIVGGEAQSVVVEPDQETLFDVLFTGTLLIDVAEARAAPEGQTVTVDGVVTWQAQWDSRSYFLQDGTAGISVFDFNGPDLQIGDRIQVTGSRGAFGGEIQISPVFALENLGFVGPPDPRPVTADEINAGQFQGELVTIDGTVQAVDVVNSFGTQVVTLTDASGATFSVFVDNRTGVADTDWTVGAVFGVTGVLGTDDRDALPHRVEVRSIDDVVLGGATISIAEARVRDGETVVVQGVVTWQTPWDDRVIFIQDATAGISLFYSGAPTLQRGDVVKIQGDVSAFRGEVQVSPTSLQVLGNVAVPSPRGVTGAQINAGDFQGELVTVTGTVQQVEELSFGNQNATIRDAAGTDFSVYVDSRNGVSVNDWPGVGSTVRVSGVLGTDDRNTPAPRIELRDIDDIAAATAGQVSIAEARGMAAATVTVEGLVTWQQQWDTRVYFLQDESGGISTFHSGAPGDLAEGERIRISGDVGAFRGEVQLSPVNTIERLGVEAVPTPRAVTGSQINAGLFQGQLVTVAGTLIQVDELSFGNQAVTIRDALGISFSVYVDSRNGMSVSDWPALGTSVEVTGVLGTDDRNVPAPRLEPRRTEDVVAGS